MPHKSTFINPPEYDTILKNAGKVKMHKTAYRRMWVHRP